MKVILLSLFFQLKIPLLLPILPLLDKMDKIIKKNKEFNFGMKIIILMIIKVLNSM